MVCLTQFPTGFLSAGKAMGIFELGDYVERASQMFSER